MVRQAAGEIWEKSIFAGDAISGFLTIHEASQHAQILLICAFVVTVALLAFAVVTIDPHLIRMRNVSMVAMVPSAFAWLVLFD